MTYRVEALGDAHDLGGFECGNSSLTEWLRSHARGATRQGTRTYVLVEESDESVVGYFAIAPHILFREDAPARLARGAPRQIPAILLAKLALDRRAQGQGLGSELLVRALETIVNAARISGGRVVVVDAIDANAARFYEHHDFEQIPGNPARFLKKLSTIAKSLDLPWP